MDYRASSITYVSFADYRRFSEKTPFIEFADPHAAAPRA